jgi:serine/threonine-protein phosphatase 4 regulatory subunit 1
VQTIVPHALLDHYLSMTDPLRAQTIDSEMAYHCAYSLPAVTLTLGRRNWPCLSQLFQNLARDMQVNIDKVNMRNSITWLGCC